MKIIKGITAKFMLVISALAMYVGTAAAIWNVTETTDSITNAGTVLSAMVGLLQTVIVNNLGTFFAIIIAIVLIILFKKFGQGIGEFVTGLTGGLLGGAYKK